MKPISLLIAVSVFFSLTLQAQSTTTVEKNEKRITITTTKMDEQGKPVTETWIAEGDSPEAILQQMTLNPDVLAKVETTKATEATAGERLFLFRSAGGHEAIEGRLDEMTTEDKQLMEERSIIIISDGEGKGQKQHKIAHVYDIDAPMAWSYRSDGEKKSNCAALGVYVTYGHDSGNGCYITSLIENGGAKAAGLQPGDVITKLDDYDVTDFQTLHQTLAKYLPGEEVTVYYTRGDQNAKTLATLKTWNELPGHEWRARTDCGKAESIKEVENEPQLMDDPNGLAGMEELRLTDARIYPNPTDGLFAFSFNTEPGPVTISIADHSGKVVYTEENENATGYYNRDINLKDVPTGTYIVTVKQGDKIFSQQISKQ